MITTINNKNYHVDIPGNRITMLDARWYYDENGNPVPSVTSILDAYPKGPEYYAWLKKVGEDADTIRDEAGRRGSKVHQLAEQYDLGVEVSLIDESEGLGVTMAEWAMFTRYVEFCERFPHENELIEANVISSELGYAGTLDRIISLNGVRILLDIKTSNAIYDSYWLQLAAYRNLLRHRGTEVDQVGILWLQARTKTEGRKDAIQGKGWQLIQRGSADEPQDLNLFNHTKALWLAQNGNMAPKQISYQLKYKK